MIISLIYYWCVVYNLLQIKLFPLYAEMNKWIDLFIMHMTSILPPQAYIQLMGTTRRELYTSTLLFFSLKS